MAYPQDVKPKLEKMIAAGTVSALVIEALEHDRSLWTNGSVYTDPFYKIDASTVSAPPGTVFSVENETDITKYTVPPGVVSIGRSYGFRGDSPAGVALLYQLHTRADPG